MNVDVNEGDFDSTFVIPEGFKQTDHASRPTDGQPINSTAGSVVSGFQGTQNLDSALARDIIGDDTLLEEIARRNT